jgi:DtxR family Mn-dependent transcriptional regulator
MIFHMPHDSASVENYLEAIAAIIDAKGYAQTTAIAQALGVKMPSVTAALKVLASKDYVTYAPYHPVRLTPKGRAIARGITRRHALLRHFLVNALDLSPAHADTLACRLEHVFDDVALKRLDAFMKKFDADPGVKQ